MLRDLLVDRLAAEGGVRAHLRLVPATASRASMRSMAFLQRTLCQGGGDGQRIGGLNEVGASLTPLATLGTRFSYRAR